ncbi:MAG: ankyrin repeat domain-containing protein, partial [Candidatus Hydrogenedentes bacterium]|nr:ankyrin repeat domain-containing protein [Candidatus Hydrogenedentota bacterium]
MPRCPGIALFRTCARVVAGAIALVAVACDTAPKPARQDAHGYTEVHHAAMDGDLDAVRKYLSEGISPNITDVDGVTPLHRAARDGNMDLARLLVQYHADVNMRTQEDWDALQFAAWHSHNDIVEPL